MVPTIHTTKTLKKREPRYISTKCKALLRVHIEKQRFTIKVYRHFGAKLFNHNKKLIVFRTIKTYTKNLLVFKILYENRG